MPDLEKPQKHSQPGCYPQASDRNTAVRLAKSPVVDTSFRVLSGTEMFLSAVDDIIGRVP